MMTLADALDIMVGRTGVERYRELCDPTHRDYHPEFIPWILEQARAPHEPAPLPEPEPEPRDLAASLRQWFRESLDMAGRRCCGAQYVPFDPYQLPADERLAWPF
jgi:hypothetical protein